MIERITRRRMLQLLGAGATAAALPRARARAQSTTPPKRIVFFYTNHGSHRPAWLPVGVGGGAPTETAYSLGELHQPLAQYKQDILLIDGLDMISSDEQSGPAKNAHIRGHCHSLVATPMADANLAGGISIDQHIAQSLRQAGVVTSVPSLEIGVDPNGESLISFARAGERLPIESSPDEAFQRLFSNIRSSTPSVAPAAPSARSLQQRTILDFVAQEFSALGPKLDREARARLEAHSDLISDLKVRLAAQSGGGQRTCAAPSLVEAGSSSEYASWYEATADNFMRSIQAAFACDLTRVVTFNLEAIPDERSGYRSINGTSDMHDMIHKVAQPGDPLSSNTEAVGIVKRFHTEYAKHFAKLLGYLKEVPEADGSNALANTIVLWCGEIAEGNHDLHQLPWLIAGQGGGSIRTGRYLQLPRGDGATRGHNDLFVSLANAMGSQIATFGSESACKGPLDGLT